MTRQIVFTGTTANDGTGDTLRDGAAKINANFQEIYDTFGPDGFTIGTQVDFDSASINFKDVTFTYKTNVGAVGPSQNQFIKFPDYSAFVVLDSATQTLRNKTLDSCSYGALLINDLSADHTYKVLPSELTGNRTITLPVASDDDAFVFANTSQTLTNKTLDSAAINNAIIADGTWQDDANNAILGFVKQSSAVNYLKIRNGSAANPIDITVDGDETNINIRLLPKGTGATELYGRVMFGDGQQSAQTSGTGGTLPGDQPAIFLNSTTGTPPHPWTLQDGGEKGQVLYITNMNGANNVEITPTNFGQGTKFAMTGGSGVGGPTVAHLIWDGALWYVINKSDVTIT
jgi:hypothetical protein